MTRACSGCNLCCKLIPVHDDRLNFHKSDGEKCRHQSFARGCKVHGSAAMPNCCSRWSCRWLVQPEDTAALSRPDRSGYVIDIMPDFVTAIGDDGASQTIQVVQVWVDPGRPEAYKDLALMDYLERRAEDNVAGLIRLSAVDGFVWAAPRFTQGRGWVELRSTISKATHGAREIFAALEEI